MECDSFDFATKKHEKQSEYGPDVLLYIVLENLGASS